MVELLLALLKTKGDVVDALRMKSLLWNKGVELSGMVVSEEDEGTIPHSFLEDLIQLSIVGHLN